MWEGGTRAICPAKLTLTNNESGGGLGINGGLGGKDPRMKKKKRRESKGKLPKECARAGRPFQLQHLDDHWKKEAEKEVLLTGEVLPSQYSGEKGGKMYTDVSMGEVNPKPPGSPQFEKQSPKKRRPLPRISRVGKKEHQSNSLAD